MWSHQRKFLTILKYAGMLSILKYKQTWAICVGYPEIFCIGYPDSKMLSMHKKIKCTVLCTQNVLWHQSVLFCCHMAHLTFCRLYSCSAIHDCVKPYTLCEPAAVTLQAGIKQYSSCYCLGRSWANFSAHPKCCTTVFKLSYDMPMYRYRVSHRML